MLRSFLNLLPSYQPFDLESPFEMQITDIYAVPGVGTVVAGNVQSGKIELGNTLYLGPDEFGNFTGCVIKSMQRKKIQVTTACAGQVRIKRFYDQSVLLLH
jgi:GTPase